MASDGHRGEAEKERGEERGAWPIHEFRHGGPPGRRMMLRSKRRINATSGGG
jgi:hypothetical protein